MKITDISTCIVSVPLKKPVVTPIHNIASVDNVMVTVYTDEGLTGISYLWTFGISKARIFEYMIQDLKVTVVDHDPLCRETLWQQMWRAANFLGHAGVSLFGISAIDTALWDIAGKAANMPLFKLLGGEEKAVPIYAGGLFISDSLDDILQEAHTYVERGFKAIKMRVGSKAYRDDIIRVKAVREAIGGDILLMLDAVQAWDTDRAIQLGREFKPFDIYWFEDPIPFDDIAGMAKIAQALDIRVTTGECEFSKYGFRRLIEEKAADILMIDLQRVGGITEWRKVAAMAEAWNLPVTPHVFFELCVHLMTSIPHGLFLEYVPWWDVLFAEPVQVTDGMVSPSPKPGLGLEFNEETIRNYKII